MKLDDSPKKDKKGLFKSPKERLRLMKVSDPNNSIQLDSEDDLVRLNNAS
jgi:hypothetical protein